MTELIACLSEDHGTKLHVERVIDGLEWEKVFIIASEKQVLNTKKEAEFILIDLKKTIPKLIEYLKHILKNKITGTEIALNLVSGSGKEHMAILSALLKLGLGIRFVALTKQGVKEI